MAEPVDPHADFLGAIETLENRLCGILPESWEAHLDQLTEARDRLGGIVSELVDMEGSLRAMVLARRQLALSAAGP